MKWLIQEKLGRIPVSGEEVLVGKCRLLIREADPKSIKSVLIFKEEEKATTVEDQPSLSRIA